MNLFSDPNVVGIDSARTLEINHWGAVSPSNQEHISRRAPPGFRTPAPDVPKSRATRERCLRGEYGMNIHTCPLPANPLTRKQIKPDFPVTRAVKETIK